MQNFSKVLQIFSQTTALSAGLLAFLAAASLDECYQRLNPDWGYQR
jgi:hypothetical protein